MKQSLSIIIASVMLTTACGSGSKKTPDANQAQPVISAEQKAIESSLPAAAIVRVQVDAEGNEDTTKMEMRLQTGEGEAQDTEMVVASFDQGATVAELKNADELDADSSAQSWCWRGGYGGFGYGYGYPAYGYGGGYYNYGYGGGYGYGGYNYYYYPRYGWGY